MGTAMDAEAKKKMFQLDKRLLADTLLLGDFPLSLVLLSRDANYPWVILVPRRESITEVYQLELVDQSQLLRESCLTARAMSEVFSPDKLNIGALGNIVSQLHLHHIARYTDDAAWPAPVWGTVDAVPYTPDKLSVCIVRLQSALVPHGMRPG